MRTDLQRLAQTLGVYVGVMSGRDLRDLRECVAVSGAGYAGCHGFEIEGWGTSLRYPTTLARQESLLATSVELTLRARTIPGMHVEVKAVRHSSPT